jgi:hypothetical protein
VAPGTVTRVEAHLKTNAGPCLRPLLSQGLLLGCIDGSHFGRIIRLNWLLFDVVTYVMIEAGWLG